MAKETNLKPWPPAGVKWYYSDEWVAIAHADCRDILPQLEKVDLVLTDPPYGISYDKQQDKMAKSGRISNSGKWKQYDDNWDKPITGKLLNLILEAGKNQVIFGGQFYGLPSNRKWLVWNKIQRSIMTDGEMAWTSFTKGLHIFDMSRADAYINKTDGKYHPTQKPAQLFQWCLELFSKEGDLILDPFLGSGTTALACIKTNRKCIGIEIEEKYCEIAAKRCSQGVFDLRGTE